MSHAALDEDFRCLGVPPDAPPVQIERAYRRKRALYAENSLATYALLDGAARQAYLARLEEAYRRISTAVRPTPGPAPTPETLSLPDPALSPGRYLQARREGLGISRQDIAGKTRIGLQKLIQIEEERFALLPAPVYLRGFVLEFARLLQVADPARLAQQYLERYRATVGDP